MKTLSKRNVLSTLIISTMILSVSLVSTSVYAAPPNPLEHQGKPMEPKETDQAHNFEFLKMLKEELKDLKTFVHMDEFSLAHRSFHV